VVLSLSLTIDACGDEADCMWADFRDSFTLPRRETYKCITLVVKKLLPGLRSFRLLLDLFKELAPVLEKEVMGHRQSAAEYDHPTNGLDDEVGEGLRPNTRGGGSVRGRRRGLLPLSSFPRLSRDWAKEENSLT
jgi:hypothetical protein